MSRTETRLAASGFVVLEAGAFDEAESDTAGCDDVVTALVAADAGGGDVSDAVADTDAFGFAEPPLQPTATVAVNRTARTPKTERPTTMRSDDVGTGLLCIAMIHPKTRTTPTRLRAPRPSGKAFIKR